MTSDHLIILALVFGNIWWLVGLGTEDMAWPLRVGGKVAFKVAVLVSKFFRNSI